jgi:hypothetical protein
LAFFALSRNLDLALFFSTFVVLRAMAIYYTSADSEFAFARTTFSVFARHTNSADFNLCFKGALVKVGVGGSLLTRRAILAAMIHNLLSRQAEHLKAFIVTGATGLIFWTTNTISPFELLIVFAIL